MINKGDLLIAEPNVLNDINFNRSVILIVECNQNGSVGFILNKALEYSTKSGMFEQQHNQKQHHSSKESIGSPTD